MNQKKSLFESSFGSNKVEKDGPSETSTKGSSSPTIIPPPSSKVKELEKIAEKQRKEILKIKQGILDAKGTNDRLVNTNTTLRKENSKLTDLINQQELSLAEARKIEPKEVIVPVIPTTIKVTRLLTEHKDLSDTTLYLYERLVTKTETSHTGNQVRRKTRKGRDMPTIEKYNDFLREMVDMGELP